MFLYLDTSALVKRYIEEAGSQDVDAVMRDAIGAGTSMITRTEVAAALARAVREGRLSEDGGQEAHQGFRDEWPDFGRVSVTDALAARAGDLAWRYALRGYDAVQLAAALLCQETFETLKERVLFASFDERLREAAGEAGLSAWPAA